ncbi:hypothetical protein [Candidatus Methanoprimaticola sp. MG2]|uniref:hypothetical protein n=1 Tax=Candidatus Methanoprimaticola sp. MG2 TaxID=3228838 RepID=UPI0039C60347
MVFCAFCAVTPVSEGVESSETAEKHVSTVSELKNVLSSSYTGNETTIVLDSDLTGVDESIPVDNTKIKVINGNNHKITAIEGTTFTGDYKENAQGAINVINVRLASTLEIKNLDIDCGTKAYGGVNVASKDATVTLTNIDVSNYHGSAFTLGYCTVSMSGCSTDDSGNAGINYDNGVKLTIDTMTGINGAYADSSTIHDAATVNVQDGNYAVGTGNSIALILSGDNAWKMIPQDATTKAPSTPTFTNLALNGKTTIYGNVPSTLTIEIANNSTATIPEDKALNTASAIQMEGEKSVLKVLGGLSKDENLTGSAVVGDSNAPVGTVQFGPDSKYDSKVVDGVKIEVDPSAMEDAYLGGVINKTETGKDLFFGKDQIVNVTDSLVIRNGAIVRIEGQLVVPEGMSITIESGGKLILEGGFASAEIDGSVVIEDGIEATGNAAAIPAGEFRINGASAIATINGDVQIDGELNVYSGKVIFNANAAVAESGVVTLGANDGTSGIISVSEDSVLTVNGAIKRTNTDQKKDVIENSGSVVYDSEVPAPTFVIVNTMKSGAIVDIQNFTIGKSEKNFVVNIDKNLKIKDLENEMVQKVTVSVTKKIGGTDTNTYSTGGITIVATAKVVKTGQTEKIETTVDVSGIIKSSDTVETSSNDKDNVTSGNIALDGANFTVSSELTLGKKDALKMTAGTNLTVTGKIDALAGTFTSENTNSSSLDSLKGVSLKDAGSIVASKAIKTSNGGSAIVNGALYMTVDSNKDDVYNYVTTDAALDVLNANADVKKVEVLGAQELTASNDVPADKTLDVKGKLNIGCAKDHNGVKLTIDATGKLNGGSNITVVDGTVYANNKTKVSGEIVSDVKSYEIKDGKVVKNGWAKWTTLAIALSEANPGETIEVSKDGALTIGSNLTIPAEVTVKVVDADTTEIVVNDGITLTVDGVLLTDKEVRAETTFAKDAINRGTDNEENTSVIVVNGIVKAKIDAKYDAEGKQLLSQGVPVSGAYYKDIDGYYVISPLSVALANIADINGDITLNGTVNAGDIVFDATDDCDILVVDGKLVASSVTLVGSKLNINGQLDGSVTVGDVTITAKNVKDLYVEDKDGKLTFDSNKQFAKADAKIKGATVTLSAGTFTGTTRLSTETVDFIVASGATLASDGAQFNTLVIEGTVTVASGKILNAANVKIMDGGVVSVAAPTSTSAPGNFLVSEKIYVGEATMKTEKDNTGASATVNGPVSGAQIFVSNGAVLDDATKKGIEGYESTEFYVGDDLWMTVYDKTADTYEIDEVTSASFDIPVENGKIDTDKPWTSDEKENFTYIGDVAKVSANVKYDIYTIAVLANEGINDVSIDGNLMQYISILGMYVSNVNLTAGTHTIEYTLANGFSGEAKLAISGAVAEGATCTTSGMSFTISGVPEDSPSDNPMMLNATVTFQLTGIEKSGFVPASPDAPAESGMGITDYLLIILVVLIVVMAIIVAMRLMRS